MGKSTYGVGQPNSYISLCKHMHPESRKRDFFFAYSPFHILYCLIFFLNYYNTAKMYINACKKGSYKSTGGTFFQTAKFTFSSIWLSFYDVDGFSFWLWLIYDDEAIICYTCIFQNIISVRAWESLCVICF